MSGEAQHYTELPRAKRQEVVRDLSQRVLEIVQIAHPEPVLSAEIEAQITEQTPTIATVDGDQVIVGAAAVAFAREQAMRKGDVIAGQRGNQVTYRLPVDPIEAGHVTI